MFESRLSGFGFESAFANFHLKNSLKSVLLPTLSNNANSIMPVKTFSSYDEFKAVINGDKPVVIDFWATWCGPCRVISPVFEKLSDDPAFAGVEFYKVDVDQQDQISQEVGVRAMPTFALFKKGEKVSDLVGARPQELQALVAKALTA